jgi:hypothetical protein
MAGPTRRSADGDPPLVRAYLARVEASPAIDRVEVRWNPAAYRVTRLARPSGRLDGEGGPAVLLGGRREEFRTELFIDTADEVGAERDARRTAETLRSWMGPGAGRPPRVLFAWGSFRFVGTIDEIEEEWIRFDPDGTPVRGRIRLVLGSS